MKTINKRAPLLQTVCEHGYQSTCDIQNEILVSLVLHPVLWAGIDFEVFSIQWNILIPEASFFDWDNTGPK